MTQDEQRQIKHHFGTVTHAFDRLVPHLSGVTWSVFRLAAAGERMKPASLEAIRAALARWKAVNLRGGA